MFDLDYIISFADEYGFPQEAIRQILYICEKIKKRPQLQTILSMVEHVLFLGEDQDPANCIPLIRDMAEAADTNIYGTYLVVLMHETKRLRMIYHKEGIDEQVVHDTLADVLFKMSECKLITGGYGLYTPAWICGYFKAKRFAFGRMQFEISTFAAEEFELAGRKIYQGDKVVAIHIPRNDQPFNRIARLDSYMSAYHFFKEKFESQEIPFTCDSWLLCSLNKRILKPTSNIVDFMNDFKVIKEVPTFGSIWRIFGVEYKNNPEEMPEDTNLMRGYKRWLLEGNQVSSGYGVFLFDGNNIYQ